jgi:transposase InsO family protein
MAQKVVSMETKLAAVFRSGLKLNVAALCRELEISRQSFYKYQRRFRAEGPAGLVERSRRPHRAALLAPEMEEAIVRLRKELPVDNGAQTIAYHLRRQGLAPPSVATIHRTLVRRGMVVPQPEKRPRRAWRRFVWPRPNDAWQIDATAWALADGSDIWIMDVLDDHSRVLVAARVCSGPTGRAAWEALAHGLRDWGAPARVMSDNGTCFTGRFSGGEVDFERQLRAMGIAQLLSGPGHPQTCGKLERSHQTTKGWLRNLDPAASEAELQGQLDHWRGYYNNDRPHRALGGATPAERWAASEPARPARPLAGPRRTSLHTVSKVGQIGWGRFEIQVGAALAGQKVLVVAKGDDLTIWGQPGLVRTLTIDPTRRSQPLKPSVRVSRPCS